MRDLHLPGRSAVYAANGICATSHPIGAQVAIETLKAGGNAVDAAIAGALVLGIAEPQMTGIGGDCFMLIKPPGSEEIIALNGSGRAPAGLDAAALRARGLTAIPTQGIEAVTMPGAIDAFCQASADYGLLSLADTLAPAIHYADEGIPVAPRVAFDWADDLPCLKGAARDFYTMGGKAPTLGQIFRAPGQAEVLRRIAREGRAGFYEGEVAEDMIASLQALGGSHTLDDLAATRCDYTTPVSGTYADVELVEHPPNGQGATAILLLNILKHFDLKAMDPFGTQRAHIEAEATKLAYDARNRFIADPGHTKRLDHMLSPDTATKLAALIDPKRAMPAAPPLTEAVHKDTIYITVVDRDRMAVSLIYSVFWGFGSGFASSKFGINFQNRGAGFTLAQGHPNEAGGGKRPMHTIIPGMIRKAGRVLMPFGVMGGAYQSTGHARFVSNLTDFGMDLQDAIDAPRCFSGPAGMEVERGYSDKVRADLSAMGHDVLIPDTPIGGAQAIRIEGDILIGASDPGRMAAPLATDIDYAAITATIRALTHGETDTVALMATVACEIHHAHPLSDWTGFYRVVAPELLKIGPYQGGHGCLVIPFSRGVCGAAARTGQVQNVPDVDAFPDHIACASSTRSELVLPVWNGNGQLLGVLDLDSDTPAAFTPEDEAWLTPLLAEVFREAT